MFSIWLGESWWRPHFFFQMFKRQRKHNKFPLLEIFYSSNWHESIISCWKYTGKTFHLNFWSVHHLYLSSSYLILWTLIIIWERTLYTMYISIIFKFLSTNTSHQWYVWLVLVFTCLICIISIFINFSSRPLVFR